ncbi:histone-lysine N-methyltransferase SETMAR-like [Anas acuta]|uniref:histone-lysine N-methyltransferase SETMAR-like n=1 Tax=Anas acuta TaxID=28680 RepID=UPI0035C8A3F6
MIKEAYGDAAMGRLGVFEWHKLFREGRERVEDDNRSGRPLTSKKNENVSRVKNLLNHDRRMSIRIIADDLSIPQTQVFEMVKENLAMRKLGAKFVPRVLSEEQKANQKVICQDLLHHVNEEPDFLGNVVTGDEMWVFEKNPERTSIVNNWQLHHDNTPSHTAFRVVDYLAQHKVAMLPQPPYSPNLAPPDFFLFLRIKSMLKGKHHPLVEALQEAVMRELNSIPVQAFLEVYENWKTCWQQCVDAEGCYFEKF